MYNDAGSDIWMVNYNSIIQLSDNRKHTKTFNFTHINIYSIILICLIIYILLGCGEKILLKVCDYSKSLV